MGVDNFIRYDLIAKAIDFYKDLGFVEINVPWHVRPEVSAITCPAPALAYRFEDGVLVGSAEQSMIQMALDGELKRECYVTCTPCFRNEPELDRFHQKYFMKVELFYFGSSDLKAVREMHAAFDSIKYDATWFFETMTDKPVQEVYTSDTDCDLEIDGIEVGSYNIRRHGNIQWVCGTGLALPRFTKVM